MLFVLELNGFRAARKIVKFFINITNIIHDYHSYPSQCS